MKYYKTYREINTNLLLREEKKIKVVISYKFKQSCELNLLAIFKKT